MTTIDHIAASSDTADAYAEAREISEGLFAFIDRQIIPMENSLGEVMWNPRLYWREDGRIADAVVEGRRQARAASADAGFYTMFCPEHLGGGGLGALTYFLVWEALCHRYGSPQTGLAFHVLAHTSTGPTALWSQASDELKEAVLPRLSEGRLQGSFAMSEPDAGSDAWMMRTTAVRDGDGWRLNGTKQWASWAPTADFLITFAVTDPERFGARRGGLTCFYVPTDAAGYSLDGIVKMYDELGGEEAILSFDDVRVPDTYRIGPVGEGFPVAMQGSGQLKLTKLGRHIGVARWAHDKAVEYAKVRETFGKTLAEHQTIQNMLADSAVELYAARLMALDVADKVSRGVDTRFEVAASHVFINEGMYRVYDRAMQVLGGIGLSNDSHMMNGWHTLRVGRLSEGPTEIQRRTVAKHVLKGR